ncbi:hypothetical protein CHLNCDRAFT_133829 [Chlorella variabilis]|uniref:Expansin-like EG45 domain-containing protein n=1 Tax=Chlorella variabilis TaxID=554065 RepID=E1ZFB9_CHLVA|nr:hypothetical protein CHLNCDRAFT_133829 [Chlorella variabilis]EFN55474.1 hypothetical protein CHLNCDRAFT_133829 [Chlorella variabilis]|eukprot:XP_005847576.1 hypothetical protein CHLNCDRAFT_133829 [Chlorella variabilis]
MAEWIKTNTAKLKTQLLPDVALAQTRVIMSIDVDAVAECFGYPGYVEIDPPTLRKSQCTSDPPTLSTLKLDLTDGYVGASAMHFDIFKDKGNPGKYVIRTIARNEDFCPTYVGVSANCDAAAVILTGVEDRKTYWTMTAGRGFYTFSTEIKNGNTVLCKKFLAIRKPTACPAAGAVTLTAPRLPGAAANPDDAFLATYNINFRLARPVPSDASFGRSPSAPEIVRVASAPDGKFTVTLAVPDFPGGADVSTYDIVGRPKSGAANPKVLLVNTAGQVDPNNARQRIFTTAAGGRWQAAHDFVAYASNRFGRSIASRIEVYYPPPSPGPPTIGSVGVVNGAIEVEVNPDWDPDGYAGYTFEVAGTALEGGANIAVARTAGQALPNDAFALRFAAGAHRSGEVYSINVFAYNQLGLKSLGSPSVTFLEKPDAPRINKLSVNEAGAGVLEVTITPPASSLVFEYRATGVPATGPGNIVAGPDEGDPDETSFDLPQPVTLRFAAAAQQQGIEYTITVVAIYVRHPAACWVCESDATWQKARLIADAQQSSYTAGWSALGGAAFAFANTTVTGGGYSAYQAFNNLYNPETAMWGTTGTSSTLSSTNLTCAWWFPTSSLAGVKPAGSPRYWGVRLTVPASDKVSDKWPLMLFMLSEVAPSAFSFATPLAATFWTAPSTQFCALLMPQMALSNKGKVLSLPCMAGGSTFVSDAKYLVGFAIQDAGTKSVPRWSELTKTGYERYRASNGLLMCRKRNGVIISDSEPGSSPPPAQPRPPRPKRPRPPRPPPPASTPAPATKVYSGKAGASGGEVSSGDGFSCPYPRLSKWQRLYYAAIPTSLWDDSKPCGRCALVTCVDSRCKVPGRQVAVFFVDQCDSCGTNGFSTSSPAFLELTGLKPDEVKVEWQYTSCAPYTTGSIRLDPKSGGNKWWQELYIYNSAEGIESVSLDGTPLKRDTWGFWVHDGEFEKGGKHELTIRGESGRALTATVSDVLKSQDLGIQF